MGRIDEALRRTAVWDGSAKAADTDSQGARDEVFVSPWSFEQPSEPSGRPARPAQAGADLVVELSPPADRPDEMALFRGFDPAIGERIVVGKAASPALAERFRQLAATLHHAQLVRNIKVIMVTSAAPGDGKSLTSTNLALTLSESYRREVLLIDADLRRPSLHDIFRVPNVAGLNEGLKSSSADKLSAIKITSRLTLLPAGRPDPDPMSSLTSPRMRRILEEASGRFDWVILDTSPIGLLADAGLLGAMVDGALLVVRAGQTPHAGVLKAIESFGKDRVLGVVLNGADLTGEDDKAARYYSAPPVKS
jgi:protein-tyrosine kinase